MVFEHIEKLKREYTDKYVVVDVSQPELRRFEGQTGQVKTVNMNGNALVEFDAYDNIGWFDIGIDFLKVIDKPLPKEVQAEKKPTAKAVAKPAAEKKPGAGGKMSVAEMLAAARGEKGGETAAASKPAAKEATATQPVAPAKAAAPTAKMSVAEMLAAARAEKSGGSATSPAQAAADEPKPASDPTPEPVAEQAPVIAAPAGDLPKDTAGILAYCRKVDG